MSYDFDTNYTDCDHMVLGEVLSLQPDRQTLRYAYNTDYTMRGLVNGLESLQLFVGGVLVSPSSPVWGYRVVDDPSTLGGEYFERRKMIQFLSPQRMNQVRLEVNYRTISAHCWKCGGNGKVHDLQANKKNSFLHIQQYPKLLQRVNKILLTSQCAFYPNLVSSLTRDIGRKLDQNLTEDDISLQISNDLQALKTIQTTQGSVQTLDPEEILKDVDHISVTSNTADETLVQVSITVSSYGQAQPGTSNFIMRVND
jgi:hypothetical protein